MVERVQNSFEKYGAKITFATVSDRKNGEFHDRDLYPFIYDLTGVCVAHGVRPALIEKNLISLKDQDGKYLIQEMIGLAQSKGSGWSTTNGRALLQTRSKIRRATFKKWAIILWG
jgi:cytochrome c